MKSSKEYRSQWLKSIAADSQFYLILNHIDHISFFAKDIDGNLLAANENFLHRFKVPDEESLFGMKDTDLFPDNLAQTFRKDDIEVIKNKTPKLNIIELFFNRQGIPDWYITHKLPVFDDSGNVIGIMGVTRSHTQILSTKPKDFRISKVVDHIRNHFRESVTIAELAEIAGVSSRQLNRLFKDSFGISPQEFIIKTRVQAAWVILKQSETPLAEIALQLGFHDQSAFSQQFKRHTGVTPLQYRKKV